MPGRPTSSATGAARCRSTPRGLKLDMRARPKNNLKPLQNCVAQVSKPAVSPTSKSAERENGRKPADLEIRDTADLEVGDTAQAFCRGLNPSSLRPDAMNRSRRKRSIPIEWRDDGAWRPRVVVRLEMKAEGKRRNEEMVWRCSSVLGVAFFPCFRLPSSRRATFSNL